jgi:energy-coupling factor transporter ATP-binding protein EcfA2
MGLIDRLRIENFKSLRHASISLGQITVLIGPNGSGKSSVLHLLALLKQSQGLRNVNLGGPLVDLGAFKDIAFRRDPELLIKIELEGSYRLSRPLMPIAMQEVNYRYEVVFGRVGLWSNSASLKSPTLGIQTTWRRGQGQEVQSVVDYGDQVKFNVSCNPEVGRPILVAVSYAGSLPPETVQRISEDAEQLQTVIASVLRDIYFVPANRGVDKRAFPLIDAPSTDFISAQGTTKQAGDVAGTLAYKRQLEERISAWSQRVTGIGVRSSMVPGREASIEATRRGLTVNIVNEGFGSNQLVLLLTQLAAAPEGAVIGIEEPEIHLHPRAQSRLAEVLAEVADEEGKQILVTTHSEHILFSLLTKAAEGKLAPDDLKVYSFERPDEATAITELPVDEKGRVKGGLAGFFDVDMEEFQRYLNALSKKQMR